MSLSSPRMSRFYLVPAAAVAVLGALALRAHLQQPSYLPGPGFGCVVTTIPGPDTAHEPAAYLELQACPHINETILDLHLYTPEDGGPTVIFSGTGPEDPHRWAESLTIRWLTADSVEVAYSPDLTFLNRREVAGPVRIHYASVRRTGG
ncbi:MAG: hypothetical protein ABI587_02105 [Gemmatimonadales bacterium]